jgi:hypothetical protein
MRIAWLIAGYFLIGPLQVQSQAVRDRTGGPAAPTESILYRAPRTWPSSYVPFGVPAAAGPSSPVMRRRLAAVTSAAAFLGALFWIQHEHDSGGVPTALWIGAPVAQLALTVGVERLTAGRGMRNELGLMGPC